MARFLNYWLPVILWMGVIFFMSTDAGSAAHTGGILEPLLRWLVPDISHAAIERAHFIVRKCGHLGEYAVLAVLFWRALMQAHAAGLGGRAMKCAGVALVLSAANAATDEFHQSFVSSRGASVRDVLVDCCGALAGLALFLLWRAWRNRLARRV